MPRQPLAPLVLLLTILAAPPAPAEVLPSQVGRSQIGHPELTLLTGGAFSPSDGLARSGGSGGGLMMGGAALWGWNDRFRFGVTGFGADFGSRIQSVRGLGGSETPQDLGDIETEHRGAWGVGWRIDAMGPHTRRWGRPFATATYQAARFGADRQGRSLETRSALAASLAAGWERAFGAHIELALAAGPTILTADETERFTSAHLEWRWRP